MKKTKLILFIALFAMVGCTQKNKPTESVTIITHGLRFCEGTVAYDTSVLVSNFGTEALNPLNNERKGYISIIEDNEAKVFIAPDQYLNGPKGMAIKDDFLYVADVSKIVVYNLKNKKSPPQLIYFPTGSIFVNDIAIKDHTAYISVTNSDKIYSLDISDPYNLNEKHLEEFVTIPGPNGLVIDGYKMYVASYAADEVTTDANVIYVIENINTPVYKKLIDQPGQYDGLALKDDKLYFTNWIGAKVGYIDLATMHVEYLPLDYLSLAGPADITISNDKLYIPNLPASQVIIYPLK